ncbi:hypothetical protein [Bradyrhizobium sp. Ai1a-2]|nr:hypothetical protein [Bradyrhizobium sp. Ai1a-2]
MELTWLRAGPSLRAKDVAWPLKAVRIGMFPASVLTTVNAPYSKKLDAQALAYCLTHPAAAKAAPGQMSAFFGEVAPALQKEFACAFHISDGDLVIAAKMFAEFSGETYPLAA